MDQSKIDTLQDLINQLDERGAVDVANTVRDGLESLENSGGGPSANDDLDNLIALASSELQRSRSV